MYTQIFFVTSVRGMVLPPQIAANAGLNVFGAKIPTPFFFFSAFSVAFVAFVRVVFVVLTVGVTVFVVVVIAIKKRDESANTLSLEPK